MKYHFIKILGIKCKPNDKNKHTKCANPIEISIQKQGRKWLIKVGCTKLSFSLLKAQQD